MRQGSGRKHRIVQRVDRAKQHGMIRVGLSLLAAAQDGLRPGSSIPSLRIIWAQLDGTVKPSEAQWYVPRKPMGPAHRQVCKGIEWIEFHGERGKSVCGDRFGGVI